MICTKSRKDWKEKWGNVLLVQKFNYKERTPRSLLITEFVCFFLFFLKKSFFFFFYFISFFFSKNFLTLMTKYVHSYHFIWLCWIQEVLQLYLTCKVIILIYCYRQCLCFSVFFYSNLHLLQLSCSNTKTIRSAVICVFAVAVWIHLVVLWLCDRGRGSAHNVGLLSVLTYFRQKRARFQV